MIKIPGGIYRFGTDENIGHPADLEGPATTIEVESFFIDETTVTNRDFKKFIDETSYVTDAERFGWSFVFHLLIDEKVLRSLKSVSGLQWWYAVEKACWYRPEGEGSGIDNRMDHPVVHVSRNDAMAYCKWAHKRLPTEIEWELAAKGKTNHEKYPWSDDALLFKGKHMCNIWQGKFPLENSEEDGYLGTAPVKSYEPNGYGLYQMIGNVWEWCVNPRGISLDKFKTVSPQAFHDYFNKHDDQQYALKGGSFLCHDSYCNRYRIAARNGNTGMSSSSNVGFRCVKDL